MGEIKVYCTKGNLKKDQRERTRKNACVFRLCSSTIHIHRRNGRYYRYIFTTCIATVLFFFLFAKNISGIAVSLTAKNSKSALKYRSTTMVFLDGICLPCRFSRLLLHVEVKRVREWYGQNR